MSATIVSLLLVALLFVFFLHRQTAYLRQLADHEQRLQLLEASASMPIGARGRQTSWSVARARSGRQASWQTSWSVEQAGRQAGLPSAREAGEGSSGGWRWTQLDISQAAAGQAEEAPLVRSRRLGADPLANDTMSHLLLQAAYDGDVKRVSAIVKANRSLGFAMLWHRPYEGTVMMWAADANHSDVVRALLDIDPKMAAVPSPLGGTVASWAVYSGNVDILRSLFAKNRSLAYWRSASGKTLLSVAADFCWPSVAQFMLEFDSSLAAQTDDKGWNPLHFAAQSCCPAIAKMLIESNSSLADEPAISDREGQTPLFIAARAGVKKCIAVADVLLRRDARLVRRKDVLGATPLMYAARHGPVQMVDLLLSADPTSANDKDALGQTPLLWAACLSWYDGMALSIQVLVAATDGASLEAQRSRHNDTAFSCIMRQLKGSEQWHLRGRERDDAKIARVKSVRTLLFAGAAYGYPVGTPAEIEQDEEERGIPGKPSTGEADEGGHSFDLWKFLDERRLYPPAITGIIGQRLLHDFLRKPVPHDIPGGGVGGFWLKECIARGCMDGLVQAWFVVEKFMHLAGREILMQQNMAGHTLLMQAASGKFPSTRLVPHCTWNKWCHVQQHESLAVLLDFYTHLGAPVSHRSENKWHYTPLMLAAYYGNPRRVDLLREATAAEDPLYDNIFFRFLGSQVLSGLVLCAMICTFAVAMGGTQSIRSTDGSKLTICKEVKMFATKFSIIFCMNVFAMYAGVVAELFLEHSGSGDVKGDNGLIATLHHVWLVIDTPWNLLGKGYCWIVAITIVLWLFLTLKDFYVAITSGGHFDDMLYIPPDAGVLTSIYHDTTQHFVHCLLVFALASIFMTMYLSAFLDQLTPATLMSRTMWQLSLLVQVYLAPGPSIGDDESHMIHLRKWWRWLTRMDTTHKPLIWGVLFSGQACWQTDQDDDSGRSIIAVRRAELVARFFMSYISNGLFRAIVLYTLPAFLAQSKAIPDFMLNAFAATFIVELDNLTSERQYTLVDDESDEDESSVSKDVPDCRPLVRLDLSSTSSSSSVDGWFVRQES